MGECAYSNQLYGLVVCIGDYGHDHFVQLYQVRKWKSEIMRFECTRFHINEILIHGVTGLGLKPIRRKPIQGARKTETARQELQNVEGFGQLAQEDSKMSILRCK